MKGFVLSLLIIKSKSWLVYLKQIIAVGSEFGVGILTLDSIFSFWDKHARENLLFFISLFNPVFSEEGPEEMDSRSIEEEEEEEEEEEVEEKEKMERAS